MLLFVARGAPKLVLVLSSGSSITVFSNLTLRFAGRGVFTALDLRSNNSERIEPREGEKSNAERRAAQASEAPKHNASSATIAALIKLQLCLRSGACTFGLAPYVSINGGHGLWKQSVQ